MSFWVIVSWVFVLLLTGVNVFVFLKLKQASEQMLKSMFPNAKNMNEALAGMQNMMSGMQGMMGGMGGGMGGAGGRGGNPFAGMQQQLGRGGNKGGMSQDAQLKAAMDMLKKMPKR